MAAPTSAELKPAYYGFGGEPFIAIEEDANEGACLAYGFGGEPLVFIGGSAAAHPEYAQQFSYLL